jgi:alkylated DNA nucleotide flippase Atl1
MVDYLQQMPKGSTITYTELSEHVGMPITARTAKLIFAREILRREHNAVWVCVRPGIGVVRLNDVEIAQRLQPWWMRGARNKLRRAEKEIEVVDMGALNVDQQARFAVDCVQRELAFTSLSRATRNRMAKVARGSSNDLPSFNIVEWAINLTGPAKGKTKS